METRARTEAFKSLVDNGTYKNGSPYVAFQGERINDDEKDDASREHRWTGECRGTLLRMLRTS